MAGSSNPVEVPESSTGNSDSSPNSFPSSGAGSLISSPSSLGATQSSSHPEVLKTNCQKMAENETKVVEKLTEKMNSNGNHSKKERKAQVVPENKARTMIV